MRPIIPPTPSIPFTPFTPSSSAGFILPLALGVIALVSLWGVLLLEQIQTQSRQMQISLQEKKLFYKAQEHLQQCLLQAPLSSTAPLTQRLWDQCCWIDDVSPQPQQNSPTIHRNTSRSKNSEDPYLRYSVTHALVHPSTQVVMGITRLQAMVQRQASTGKVLAYSWREVFDLAWEHELNRTSLTPYVWDSLPLCQHAPNTL